MAQESCAIILPQFIAVCVIALSDGPATACDNAMMTIFLSNDDDDDDDDDDGGGGGGDDSSNLFSTLLVILVLLYMSCS